MKIYRKHTEDPAHDLSALTGCNCDNVDFLVRAPFYGLIEKYYFLYPSVEPGYYVIMVLYMVHSKIPMPYAIYRDVAVGTADEVDRILSARLGRPYYRMRERSVIPEDLPRLAAYLVARELEL